MQALCPVSPEIDADTGFAGWKSEPMRRFQQVDVFSAEPFKGNPLAVILDADDLSTETMRDIARWTNLSETTFVMSPTDAGADYKVRIFSLANELAFAGHPTLGSCHAWLTAGGTSKQSGVVVQECGAGLVPIRHGDNGALAFAAPPMIRSGPVEDATLDAIADVLQTDRSTFVDTNWADNGPGWVVALLASAEDVLAIEPLGSYREPINIGIVGPYPEGGDAAFEVRAIFTGDGGVIREDPVTGSLNASVAQWLLSTGRATAPYTASQGTRLDRAGRPTISQDGDGTIWVGGDTVTRISGSIDV